MKKEFRPLEEVFNFIQNMPNESQVELVQIITKLEEDGRIVPPYGKKIADDLFEIRVRKGKQTRVFYYYAQNDIIYGVHAFYKKTQKTPLKEIKYAQKVIKQLKKQNL